MPVPSRLRGAVPTRRARELLLALASERAAGGLRVNELALVADLPRSVVGSSLAELEALGAVRQRGGTSALTDGGRALVADLEAGALPPEPLLRVAPPADAAHAGPADDGVLRDVVRLQAVQDTGLGGPGPAHAVVELDDLAELARRWAGVPCAMVTLASDRELRVSGVASDGSLGDAPRVLPLEATPCREVVIGGRELIAGDARADPRTSGVQRVADGSVGAYLGVPLRSAGGEVIGALCFIDDRIRPWGEHELGVARTLASVVQARLRIRALPRRLAV